MLSPYNDQNFVIADRFEKAHIEKSIKKKKSCSSKELLSIGEVNWGLPGQSFNPIIKQ